MATNRQRKEESSEQERQEAMLAYEGFLAEAREYPVKFAQHDSGAHDDEALYRLVNRHGMEWYGWYWLLVELLTARRGHSYDVSDEAGWRRLARDMSCMVDIGVDECRLLVGELAAMGLVSQEHLSELNKVVMRRVMKDAEKYAEEVAKKKLGAWKTNRRRMFG